MRGILREVVATLAIATAALCSPPSLAATQPSPLPQSAAELLLVGDSITAGMYFLELSAESAREGWSGQLLQRLGIPGDSLDLSRPYPVDHLRLTQHGFGIAGLGYPWRALPALLPGKRIGDGNDRIVWAIPGQRAREVLVQSQRHRGNHSAGWSFGRRMLGDASVLEAIEQSGKHPRWVVLFIGANDLLASLNIVAGDGAPAPEAFGQTYSELVRRLRAVMPADAPARQLCVVTLPDVTALPLIQPAPANAVDGAGQRLLPGSKVAAFVAVYRRRFDRGEYWTPAALAHTQELGAAYNAQIRGIAANQDCSVADVAGLVAELHADPGFSALRSSYFSPDLHHPSYRTHARIATCVLDAMTAAARLQPLPAPPMPADPLPSAAELTAVQHERADALLFLAMRTLARSPIPPRPTLRVAVQAMAQAGPDRTADAGVGVEAMLEGTPTPIGAGWSSRGVLGARAVAFSVDDRLAGGEFLPRRGVEFRAAFAFEPIGHWYWARLAGGGRAGLEGAAGGFLRAEWRGLYADVASHGVAPDQVELGWNSAHPLRRHRRND